MRTQSSRHISKPRWHYSRACKAPTPRRSRHQPGIIDDGHEAMQVSFHNGFAGATAMTENVLSVTESPHMSRSQARFHEDSWGP
ncbi:hypothetical protein DOTSEDRAFT_72822 [Dothistroma septosporum NZE10]|uniref:Uncharacterized protein n=1 Tax=Dothistroma septosporum (strain NZE10 / CBS 128990) TaxID=675120 RepID=M2WNI9_DOTSN|nr:hypothetical protein DOTSEDRAFT_72822 [Dothistroma septosporum NZE10]